MSDELKNTFQECKKIYRDIIFGFSEKRFKSSKKKVYIKHLNEIDNGVSSKKYDDYFFIAKKYIINILIFIIKHYWLSNKII